MAQTFRLRPGDRLVLASHNPGKVREIEELIRPFGIALSSAAVLGLPEPEETGSTYEENARLKAVAAATASGLPALADDSGMAVDALGGAPGIYSARWAGPDKDFSRAMRNVEETLQRQGASAPAQRRGSFIAVLSLALPHGAAREWRGAIAGTLVWPPRGTLGFGYDPMFLPDGLDRTFGEISSAEKHGWTPGGSALSHRARAFAAFAADVLEPA